jgi:hypothetical protein
MVEEIVVGFEHAVRQPVVTHVLPDILDRVEFRAFRRQRDDADVGWHHEVAGEMPAGLVEEQHGVGSRCHLSGNFSEMEVHGLCVAGGQDEGCAFAVLGTDRSEDVGRGGALIVGRAGARPALRPSASDLVLLADPRFVGEPDLYCGGLDAFLARDGVQAGGKVFLYSSIAPAAWA